MRPNWLETLMWLIGLAMILVGSLSQDGCVTKVLNDIRIDIHTAIQERRDARAEELRDAWRAGGRRGQGDWDGGP